MIPNPLHPAVVHFPIVLAFMLPFAAAAGYILTRKGIALGHGWLPVAILALALSGSAWASTLSGEEGEERVEEVVPHDALEEHEEAGERFLWGSLIVSLMAVLGMVPRRTGQAFRVGALVGSLVLPVLVASAGHTGGELVYKHGAASAYTTSQSTPDASTPRSVLRDDEDDDTDRD